MLLRVYKLLSHEVNKFATNIDAYNLQQQQQQQQTCYHRIYYLVLKHSFFNIQAEP